MGEEDEAVGMALSLDTLWYECRWVHCTFFSALSARYVLIFSPSILLGSILKPPSGNRAFFSVIFEIWVGGREGALAGWRGSAEPG